MAALRVLPRRRAAPLRHAAAGFTLVELLTVLAIISVLAGITFASISYSRRFADQKATAQEIQMLSAAIDRYNVERGDYPSTSLGAFKVKVNNINEGNESLVFCLQGRKKGGPYHEPFKEDRLRNGDGDRLAAKDFQALKRELDPPQGSDELFEYVDLWGNPFVYIHYRDYGSKKLDYVTPEGAKVAVQGARSLKLATYQSPTSYQIWSFGPDGVNNGGEGDDIASWK